MKPRSGQTVRLKNEIRVTIGTQRVIPAGTNGVVHCSLRGAGYEVDFNPQPGQPLVRLAVTANNLEAA